MTLQGLFDLPWWGYVAVVLAFTHVTMAGVTIYFHRHQAHRALDLHPVIAHFFRCWLWLTTGNVTREWIAVHRKHHAKVETPQDPHSPWQAGIGKVLLDGVDLYRRAAADRETLDKYGHGAPDDWIERHLYTPRHWLGLALMFAIDVVCFGPIGITIWAVQGLWYLFFAAGVINGLAHWRGYRNYEVLDGSTNISPFGLLIGGEELHNNHHAFASSAKFSSKWWEFDVSWLYIRALETFGLAKVRKLPPKLIRDGVRRQIDGETVKAVVYARFTVLALFARDVLLCVHRDELRRLKRVDRASWALLKRTRTLVIREKSRLSAGARDWLRVALSQHRTLAVVYAMRERLIGIWTSSATTPEQLVAALGDWCRDAEATGIEALQKFSLALRGYRLASGPL